MRPRGGERTLLAQAITSYVSAADGGESYTPPSISEFFPPAIWGAGTPFEFNRIQLVRWIMLAALLLFFVLVANRSKIVPGRVQNVAEMGLDFVRNSIAFEILGEKLGRKYVTMLTVIFFTVLTMNLAGVIPFLNIPGTSTIALPLLLALWVYITYLAAGFKEHGFGGFLKSQLMPSGVPAGMYVLLIPLEFLQVFILRPATLTIRLLANMIGGHLMLVFFFGSASYLLLQADAILKPIAVLSFAGGFLFTLFELLVAFLQAYIFALLAAVYIQMSTSHEH
ncbi:F0F1 ATP synthase subunit A [Micrococcales bacterium 31B]|nr:F0F1 ATP synthase subunit A [Micrococcales bacterium 31B]